MGTKPTSRLLRILFLTGWLAGCSQEGLSVQDAWIAEAPPTVPAQAGYFVIENHDGRPRALVGASAEAFESAELHQTVHDAASGLAKMVHREQVDIAAGATFKFEPGGYHLMLIKPKKRLKEGDMEPMTLIFGDGQRLDIQFEVRRERFKL